MTENTPAHAPTLDDVDRVRHRLRAVSHDVRSMLGPIIGFAELIAVSDDVEQCRSHADRIMQASSRLEKLADGLVERVLDGDQPAGSPEEG